MKSRPSGGCDALWRKQRMEAFLEQLLGKGLSSITWLLPRVTVMFFIFPIFSAKIVTGLVRGALVLLICFYMSPLVGPVPVLTVAERLAVIAKEALIGGLLGLALGLFLWVVQSVGDLIDFQTGSSNASFFDPVSGHEGGPTGQFLHWVAMVLFVSAGGLLGTFALLAESFQMWPVFRFFPHIGGDILPEFAIREGNLFLMWLIKLAAPVVLILLLVEIGLGLISRFIPQLNVFVFSQPLKGALALLMMALFLHFVYSALQPFLGGNNSMLEFLRHTFKLGIHG